MALSQLQQTFRSALLLITDNIDFIYSQYLASREDKVRQEIIDGIINGNIKTEDDISYITMRTSPCYDIIRAKGLV